MPKRPGWIDLQQALNRLSEWAVARPFDGMRNEDAKKVIRKLEALLIEGNIRCVIYVGNEAVELAVKDMLSVPFGIHFEVNGKTVGVEVWTHPDHLSRMSVHAEDLATAIAKRLPSLATDEASAREPALPEREAAFQTWLEAEMRAGRRQAKTKFQERAVNHYDLSLTTFKSLWASTIEKTGSGWDKPGRRKGT